MIALRIIDNDMGAVLKVPLTGRGTIHGVTVGIDSVTAPEIDISILEMLASDMGVPRFESHVQQHVQNIDHQKELINRYTSWVKPINQSGRNRY